jgi:hypothetical protein
MGLLLGPGFLQPKQSSNRRIVLHGFGGGPLAYAGFTATL